MDIRNRCSKQNATVFPFHEMGEHQPLPVPVQLILTAVGITDKSASGLSRLQKKMYLCIMTQRLLMSDSLYRLCVQCNGFFIKNSSLAKGDVDVISFLHDPFKNFNLYRSHHMRRQLLRMRIPFHL